MKFTRVIGRKELIQAAIFGSVAGVVGVVFFIFMLNSMHSNDVQEAGQAEKEEVIPVQSNETSTPSVDVNALQFYANQHGVFSSFSAASDFMSGFSSLNTSIVIQVDDNYYVWSEVSPIKDGITKKDNPSSFAKAFKLSSNACTNPSIQNLPTILSSEDRAKFYFEGSDVPENLPEDWKTITVATASLSDDLDVTRMHLLKHYYELNDCLKIQF
nr:hypothetical protein [Lysinibacillus timonensis]